MNDEDYSSKEDHYYGHTTEQYRKYIATRTEEQKRQDEDPNFTGQKFTKEEYASGLAKASYTDLMRQASKNVEVPQDKEYVEEFGDI